MLHCTRTKKKSAVRDRIYYDYLNIMCTRYYDVNMKIIYLHIKIASVQIQYFCTHDARGHELPIRNAAQYETIANFRIKVTWRSPKQKFKNILEQIGKYMCLKRFLEWIETTKFQHLEFEEDRPSGLLGRKYEK